MEYVDIYDDIFVVSDLHLGGDANFEIFGAGKELAALVERIAELPPDRRIGLVINGDFVDFLAEEGARHFNPFKAVRMLQRIATDESYVQVWAALRAFVGRENRALVVVLGNHDIELALPWVQEWLANDLAGGRDHHRGRVRFAMNKGGYLCRVGKSKVLCVHGNEDDPFNAVDHKKLADITADMVQGRTPEEWIPNAGSRMVIEIMNEVKEKHPFINLFKPDFGGAVTALAFVDPSHLKRIPRAASVFADMGKDFIRLKTGFLGGREAFSGRPPMDGDALLEEVEQAYANEQTRERILMAAGMNGEYLGRVAAIWKRLRGESEGAVLREALEGLVGDKSFEPGHADNTFKSFDKKVNPEIPFIVAGHTHHRRALERDCGRGFYFNSGTWAHLMRITPEMLNDEAVMEKLGKLLREGTLAELDKAGYLLRERTVVHIASDGNKTVGALCDVPTNPHDPLVVLKQFADERA